MNWTHYFVTIAEAVSKKSKDNSTKMGAIIVSPISKQILSTGFNGFPRGVNDYKEDPEIASRYERPEKYLYTEHAERNAIYHAASYGIPLNGSVMVLNRHVFPCVDCARAIIQAGIIKVIGGPSPDVNAQMPTPNWRDYISDTQQMFNEAGVIIMNYNLQAIKDEYEDPIFLINRKEARKIYKQEVSSLGRRRETSTQDAED